MITKTSHLSHVCQLCSQHPKGSLLCIALIGLSLQSNASIGPIGSFAEHYRRRFKNLLKLIHSLFAYCRATDDSQPIVWSVIIYLITTFFVEYLLWVSSCEGVSLHSLLTGRFRKSIQTHITITSYKYKQYFAICVLLMYFANILLQIYYMLGPFCIVF